MQGKRATDISTNQRIIMPMPRPSKEECDLEVRTGLFMEAFKEYREENCNYKGKQKKGILTKPEEKGLKKILKRIEQQEIVVRETDKSGKFSISSWENYAEQGKVHVGTDREISRKNGKKVKSAHKVPAGVPRSRS